jgi:hypothetical protein
LEGSRGAIYVSYIGVVSVVSQYNCVYYSDTRYIRHMTPTELGEAGDSTLASDLHLLIGVVYVSVYVCVCVYVCMYVCIIYRRR